MIARLSPRCSWLPLLATLVALSLVASACSSTSESAQATDTATSTDPAEPTDTAEPIDPAVADNSADTNAPVDVELFFEGALVETPTIEPCTLSGGAETMCYVLVAGGDPVTYETGPFCPPTIDATEQDGGLWFDGEAVYDVDGAFIEGLAELYDDDNWLMYDENGNVNRTETAEEFDLAARPNVDPSLQNHCVEGLLEFLPNGEPVTSTITIPVEPILADDINNSNGNLGVTLDGIVIAQAAPVDAILGAYTIAAFDDCGGHYNPVDGYHLHGAVGCSELEGDAADGETAMFAYAADGFPIHSPLDAGSTIELDECNGHETEQDGYHYHANDAAENRVLDCFVGQTVGASGDAGGRPAGPPPDGERPDGTPPADG